MAVPKKRINKKNLKKKSRFPFVTKGPSLIQAEFCIP